MEKFARMLGPRVIVKREAVKTVNEFYRLNPLSERKRIRRVFTELEIQDMLDLREAGYTLKNIANTIGGGVDPRTVARVIDRERGEYHRVP